VGRSDTGSAVSDWLVRHREFSQIVTDHFWLDFDLVEHLSVVDADNGADHLGNDDDRSKMGLDAGGLGSGLVGVDSALGSSESLEEVFLSALDASGVVTSLAAAEELNEVFGLQVQELVKIDASEGVLLESSLLFDLHFRHSDFFCPFTVC